MSGPKISVYTLTDEQRAIIAEERRRRQLEKEKHRALELEVKECVMVTADVVASLQQYQILADEAIRILSDTRAANSLSSCRAASEQILKAAHTLNREADNEILERKLNALTQQVRELKASRQELSVLCAELEPHLQATLSDKITQLFKPRINENSRECGNSEIIASAGVRIAYFLENGHQPISMKKKLREISDRLNASGENQMDTYIALEVQPVLRKCASYEELWNQHGAEYTTLCNRYETLCAEVGVSSPNLFPFSAESIIKLKAEIAALEDCAQKQAEDAYIAQTLSDVMADMGYEMWGNRSGSRKNGQRYVNDLFRFSEETALSVTYSDDGRIALELGKVDLCDRLPSPVEGMALEKQMTDFCTKFAEIEDRLASHGIVLGNRLMMAPATTEFAQIINMNDYKMLEQNEKQRSRHQMKRNHRHLDTDLT